MATPKNAKNTGVEAVDELDETQFADWEQQQLGFAPYFKPGVNMKPIHARVITADLADPDFVRFVMQNLGPTMQCGQGPVTDGEIVPVKRNEFFSISNYAGLPLEDYLGHEILLKCTGTRKTGKPNDMFVFTIETSPETTKLLAVSRAQRVKELHTARNKVALPEVAGSAS